jgi:hypothetical protein
LRWQGDVAEVDVSGVDVFLCICTAFDEALMRRLVDKLQEARDGSFVSHAAMMTMRLRRMTMMMIDDDDDDD